MLLKNKTVAIAGGGPGGLTLARLLQKKGIQVTVYERDQSRQVRVQGATLDLHQESGLKALAEAGLMDAFKASYRPGADKLRVLDSAGVIHFDDHHKPEASFDDPWFRPEIDRGPLRDLLLDSLQPGTVVWNSHTVGLTRAGAGWQLQFNNGNTATADIVIGADGANSRVRPFVTPVKPVYSGVTCIEGTVYDAERTAPAVNRLLKGGKLFVMGDERTLIVSSKGDGSMPFYIGMKVNEHWVRDNGIDFSHAAQVYQWFKKEFPNWSSMWHELFDNDNNYFMLRPQYHMPLDQQWKAQPDITLLGDAAHVMPPYAGEGVNMAMLDALELSECLTSDAFGNVQLAIQHYEVNMRARASEVGRLTLEQTAALHAPDSLPYLVGMFKEMAG
jgi:2-polyprenyl-6-methoxyphenol hydroxylase-like FAD-dependent oxidoreductase